MDEMASLSHTKGECKYHVVFIPQERKALYGELRRHLAEVRYCSSHTGRFNTRCPRRAHVWGHQWQRTV